MALDATLALVTTSELVAYLGGQDSLDDRTGALERAINAASGLIGNYLGRRLIKPATDYVEFHTVWQGACEIRLNDWPIDTVTSVHEDVGRVYGASSLLTADVDYIVSKPLGRIIRVWESGGPRSWLPGFRAIRVAFMPQYPVADVPAVFKDACLWTAAMLMKESDRKQWGLNSLVDAAGNFTRLSGAHLPGFIKEQLAGECDLRFDITGERDS
jgi:hypothetical protein